jgi:hypothetical protein
MHAEQAALLAEAGASMYAVEGDEASWTAALQMAGKVPSTISVKASAGKSKRQLEQESFAAGKHLDTSHTTIIMRRHSIFSKKQKRCKRVVRKGREDERLWQKAQKEQASLKIKS